jgi:hypothetical protein
MWKYYAFVVFMVLAEAGIVAMWFTFDQMKEKTRRISDEIWVVRIVDSNWLALICAPIIILLLAGIVLSIQTRNVQSKFNESHYVGLATYAVSFAFVVVGTIVLWLDNPSVVYIISTVITSATTIGVLIIFFAHKVSMVLFPQSNNMVNASGQGTGAANEEKDNEVLLRCKYCRQTVTGANSSSNLPTKNSKKNGSSHAL